MSYLLFALVYFMIGYVVGKGMYRAGFEGSEDTVKMFGGMMWPITMWLLLIVVSGNESLKK